MAEPIVFISHHRIKEGKLEALRNLHQEVVELIEEQKPDTLVFLAYVDEDAGEVSFVHVFPDAESMDTHIQGAAERSKKAYEFMQPRGFEIYGKPSAWVLEMMEQTARSGATLSISTDHLGGFLRLKSG
jgi:quinol monooxygenase YgiN